MKITVFTSNQARHISLINRLASIANEVFCIQEVNTVFPGQVADFFKKTDVFQSYFKHVIAAERKIFGELDFLAPNVRSLSVKSHDLNYISSDVLEKALSSDCYIVFGASYIKGWLIDFLVKQKALNIHIGLSPYYRGASCNFWALYDNNPNYVGATIHMLTKGLDSGPMLYHCLPELKDENPFEFTMKSVYVAQSSLVSRIQRGEIFDIKPIAQSTENQIRYTRNLDFNDERAFEFLSRNWNNSILRSAMQKTKCPELLNPYRE